MDPNGPRDIYAEEMVEDIIFEAGEEGDYNSPSFCSNTREEAGGSGHHGSGDDSGDNNSGDNNSGDNDAGEEAGGSGEAGEVYMTRGINAILYVFVQHNEYLFS